MNADIFLHGTPNGQSVYPSSLDRDDYAFSYYRYDIGIGTQSLVVETKVLNNILNCYYTYYVHNVLDINGRPGGYFAITLRSDTFIRNLNVMFQIMDIIYNQLVVGTILSGGNVNKFLVKSFNDQEKKVIDVFKNIFSQVIKACDIVKIDESFLGNSGSPLSFNPCDSRCIDLLTQYKSAEKITISPSAPLLREQAKAKEYQEKICFVKRESEDKLKNEIRHLQIENHSLQRDNKKYEVQINDAEAKIKSLTDTNISLKNRLSEYEIKMKSLTKEANIKEELAKISDPILRLNGMLQRFGITPSQQRPFPLHIQLERALEDKLFNRMPSKKSANRNFLLSFIAVVLLLIVLTIQLVLVFRENSLSDDNKEIETIPEQKLSKGKETSPDPTGVADFNNMIMNIKEYDGKGSLQYGREYSLYISSKGHSNRPDSFKGLRWVCDGGEIYYNGGNDARLRLKKKDGPVKIICHLPNGESIVRVIEASSDEKKKVQYSAPVPEMKKNGNRILSSKKESSKL